MESDLIEDAQCIFEVAFEKKQPVMLHELLWTIDAKHRLILNTDEINSAINCIVGIIKTVDGNQVKLNPLIKGRESDYVNDKDVEKAMNIYNQVTEKSKFK